MSWVPGWVSELGWEVAGLHAMSTNTPGTPRALWVAWGTSGGDASNGGAKGL